MRVIEAFIEIVAKSRLRQIVTLTSDMGSIEGNASGGSHAYRSSKAAVNMCEYPRDRSRPRVICVAVNPGWARTDTSCPRGNLSPPRA